MNMQALTIIIGICCFGYVLVGGELKLDDHYFAVKRLNLGRDGHMATSVAKRKVNAKALCLLAMQVTNTTGLSNTTQLSVMVSATEAVDRYVRAIPHSSKELEEFAVSSEILDSLFLLETSADMLSRIPEPHLSANIAPPPETPGPSAGGMDPKAIQDPKARAEYEKRIADNADAVKLLKSRSRLKQTTTSLQDALRIIMLHLTAEEKAESFITAISTSKLPTKIKVYILANQP